MKHLTFVLLLWAMTVSWAVEQLDETQDLPDWNQPELTNNA